MAEHGEIDVKVRGGVQVWHVLAAGLGLLGATSGSVAVLKPTHDDAIHAVQAEQIRALQEAQKDNGKKLDDIATSLNQIKGRMGIK